MKKFVGFILVVSFLILPGMSWAGDRYLQNALIGAGLGVLGAAVTGNGEHYPTAIVAGAGIGILGTAISESSHERHRVDSRYGYDRRERNEGRVERVRRVERVERVEYVDYSRRNRGHRDRYDRNDNCGKKPWRNPPDRHNRRHHDRDWNYGH